MGLAVRLWVASLVVALAGCATTDRVTSRQSEATTSTSIAGHWRKDRMQMWEGHRLDSVDGKTISFGLALNPYAVVVNVEPGQRKLVVLTLFNINNTQLSATIPMTVDLKPATNYAINAVASGVYIEAWLEVAGSGEKASETFKGVCHKSTAEGMFFKKGPCGNASP